MVADKNGWISVQEKLPKILTKVLIYIIGGIISIDYTDDLKDHNIWALTSKDLVTHWMPLPNAPISSSSSSEDNNE